MKRGNCADLTQMYVADLETCDSDDIYRVTDEGIIYNQRVWLAGLQNIGSGEIEVYTNLDDFMKGALKKRDNLNREIGIHNLKFDGSFIVPWLLKNGYRVTQERPGPKEFSVLIDDRNNWYTIRVQVNTRRRVEFWDTLKLFPTALEYLHLTYSTPTEKIKEDENFYNEARVLDHKPTKRELEYMYNDLQVLTETIREHVKYNGLRFRKTQASQSFYNFSQHFKAWKWRFPALDTKTDSAIRPGYWGGISHVNEKYKGKDVKDIYVYDINSSYPYQLAFKKLPYGQAIAQKGQGVNPDMSKFWVAEVVCEFTLKENKIPCIPTKAAIENRPYVIDKWIEDSDGLVRIVLCNIDYVTIQESYNFKVLSWEWVIEYAWKVQPEIAGFILENNDNKIKYSALAKKEKDKHKKAEYQARSQRAKIDNNSFYGKFGEDIIKEGKTPYLINDDVEYLLDRKDIISEGKRKYLPVAIATTAWGRQQLVRMANLVGEHFIYCDTDSIHITKEGKELLEKNIVIDPLKLGAWDFENYYNRGRFLRSKCYYEQKEGETADVTLAGLPADKGTGPRSKKRSCITWDNFHIGLNIIGGNGKLRTVKTATGNKLVPTDFKITEKFLIFF